MMRIGIFSFFLFLCINNVYSWTAQEDDEKYQRCSVISMMIEHPMYLFNDEIADAFRRIPLSARFNNHNLGVRVVKFATQEYTDQTASILSFIKQIHLGTRTVAKWFNWNKETGLFDMDMVRARGMYNANALDYELASKRILGNPILADAGEHLISQTYLVMSDICYKGKYSIKESNATKTGNRRRFDVSITSYIFQLDWNEETLNSFYTDYWQGKHDFVQSVNKYGFVYRGKVETDYSESSAKFTQSELIERVVARSIDINFAKLQKVYPDFRIKALLISDNPIQADIGLKEGVIETDLYEVLEKSVDEKGIAKYTRVGIIRPIKGMIWDNRYGAEIDNSIESKLGYTTFEKVSGGDFYPGMYIREIKSK